MADYGATGGGDWHPTVKYLLVLILVEIFVMGLMRTYTKHGG